MYIYISLVCVYRLSPENPRDYNNHIPYPVDKFGAEDPSPKDVNLPCLIEFYNQKGQR